MRAFLVCLAMLSSSAVFAVSDYAREKKWADEITPRSRPVTVLTAIGTASMANMVPPARISFLKLNAVCVMYLSIV